MAARAGSGWWKPGWLPMSGPRSRAATAPTPPPARARPMVSALRRLTASIAPPSPSSIGSGLGSGRGSRLVLVVADLVHVPEQHHGVVLVDGVVAVHGIGALVVAEAHDQLDLVAWTQLDRVLAPVLHRAGQDGLAVVPEDAELLQVDVDGVLPASGVVLEDPALHGVLLHREAEVGARHELAVDLPLTVAPLETEGPGETGGLVVDGRQADGTEDVVVGRGGDVGERHGLGVEAGVDHLRSHQPEFDEGVPLPGGQDLARRTSPVHLLQAVLQPYAAGVAEA